MWFAMWGKTEQMRTSGAQLLPEQEISNYFITFAGDVVGKNTKDYSKIIQNTENTTYYIFRKNVGTRFRAAYVDAIPTGNTPCTGVVDDTKDNISITVPAGKVLIINMEDVKAFDGLMVQKTRDRLPYEPYTGGFPSPSPDYPQPIEITDQPVTITVKGGTEQQSITLIPPRPFTKWDKLEKVDGVWYWVYQSKVLSGAEIKENFMGIHSSGSVMINISTLGVMDEQNDAVSDKFIYSTRSVATLKNGEFRIAYGNAYLKIDGVATDEEGRQWLESNDITIIAQASTPESIPLSPSEQAQLNALTMYAGTTEVTNTGGCNMELTYTVDTKSYVDSKIAAISAAVLEV